MTKAERIVAIINTIDENRINAREKCVKQRAELFDNNAKYAKLVNERHSFEMLVMSKIKNTGVYDERDKVKLSTLCDEIISFEIANGITNAPECTLCNDTGYRDGAVCDCVIKKLKDNPNIEPTTRMAAYDIRDKSKIEKLFAGTIQETAMLGIYDSFCKYSEQFPNLNLKNILLLGGSGCGKSGAVISLYNELTRLGHATLYLSAFSMHNAFLKYHTSPLESKAQYMDKLLDVDFLVIDDLGTEPIFKNVTLEYLYLLIESRLTANKGTAITTNLQIDALVSRYGERLVSRMTSKAYTFIRQISNCSDLRGK